MAYIQDGLLTLGSRTLADLRRRRCLHPAGAMALLNWRLSFLTGKRAPKDGLRAWRGAMRGTLGRTLGRALGSAPVGHRAKHLMLWPGVILRTMLSWWPISLLVKRPAEGSDRS